MHLPSPPRRPLFAAAAILLLASLGVLPPSSASAIEFRLDGYYRFRARLYDNLSLERNAENSDGNRNWFEQRLRLQPHLRLNPNVHVFIDLDVLDALRFGANPEVLAAAGQIQENGTAFDEPVGLSDSSLPGDDYRESLFLRRAWVELYTPYVDVKIGRMGNQWGMGLLANDGNCDTCDYGDTVDRIMISTSMIDPVRLNIAFDTRAEGFVNRNDDTFSLLASGGYLGEVHRVGGYVRWTRQSINKWNSLNGSLWGATRLGPLSVELEALINWGKAASTEIGVDDFKLLSAGGAFKAELAVNPWAVGLEVGIATGDKDPSDANWKTFRMDRDHDIGLILFEQPMPVFGKGDAATDENGNIDESLALTGEGVSNALYLKPHFYFDVRDNLRAQVNIAAAFPVVKEAFDNNPLAYGVEFGGEATWRLFGAFELRGAVAVFLPGDVYGEGLSPIFGAEARAMVHF